MCVILKNIPVSLISQPPLFHPPLYFHVFPLYIAITLSNSFYGQKKAIDFNTLYIASATIYTYVSIIPAIVWGVTKYFRLSLPILDIVNVYGYGLSLWIPIAVIRWALRVWKGPSPSHSLLSLSTISWCALFPAIWFVGLWLFLVSYGRVKKRMCALPVFIL